MGLFVPVVGDSTADLYLCYCFLCLCGDLLCLGSFSVKQGQTSFLLGEDLRSTDWQVPVTLPPPNLPVLVVVFYSLFKNNVMQ